MSDSEVIGVLFLDGETTGGVRLERRYATSVEDLWAALVTPERLSRWFAPVSGDLRPGGAYVIAFSETDRTTGEIRTCKPPHLLEISWVFVGEPASEVRASLRADGDDAVLVLEHTRMSRGMLPGYGAGWQAYLEALSADVAGTTYDIDWMARQQELAPGYQAALAALISQ